MEMLSLELELQSTDVLVNVLTVIARLRGEVTHLRTRSRNVHLAVHVPAHVAHRVGSLLLEIIGVISLEMLANSLPEGSDDIARSRMVAQ